MSTPQIKNHTATLFNKKLYIFGGYDGKKNHCNLRMFDTVKDCWQKSIKPDGTPPQGRNGHTATLVSTYFCFHFLLTLIFFQKIVYTSSVVGLDKVLSQPTICTFWTCSSSDGSTVNSLASHQVHAICIQLIATKIKSMSSEEVMAEII